MKPNKQAVFVLLSFIVFCYPFHKVGANPPSIDWWRDNITATGLSRLSSTAGSQAKKAAADLATQNGNLRLRRILYQLPVTQNSTLGMVLVRFPTLQPLIDRELKKERAPGRVIAPDLLEVRVKASLMRLRRLVGPVLLGKDPTTVEESDEPKVTSTLIITPPEGAGFKPGLLPLLGCAEKTRDVYLRRLIAAHVIGGGPVSYITKAVAKAKSKTATLIKADAVGGLGRACLFLKDAVADQVIDSLKSSTKENPVEIAIVLPKTKR